jgi:putative transposase
MLDSSHHGEGEQHKRDDGSGSQCFFRNPPKGDVSPGVDMREVLNAIRYIARAGCGWRMLPKDFPRWQTVYWWFRRFMRRFLFETIHDVA